nr:hypothetical protein [Tanacetum cinerariifolium]
MGMLLGNVRSRKGQKMQLITREKMLLCKQEEARIQLNVEQADWKDDTDDESDNQELEAHYMYMAKLQQVSPDVVDSGPIFDKEPEQKNTALPAAQGDAQSWISDLARQTNARSSFNEILDTPIDFSNFIMHRVNVDTLTPDLLASPTYELMRGSCTSLTELEYHYTVQLCIQASFGIRPGYALTIKSTVFVSHIRQFWSTARIETTDEGTHILAAELCTPETFVVQKGVLRTRYLFLNSLKIVQGVQSVDTR